MSSPKWSSIERVQSSATWSLTALNWVIIDVPRVWLHPHLSAVTAAAPRVLCFSFFVFFSGAFLEWHELFEWASPHSKNMPKKIMYQILAQNQGHLALSFFPHLAWQSQQNYSTFGVLLRDNGVANRSRVLPRFWNHDSIMLRSEHSLKMVLKAQGKNFVCAAAPQPS